MNKLIFNDFLTRIKHNKKNILVIGDAMLDQYYFGSIDRISPEAPVPIFSVKEIENKLGGAANVVNNIINFGVKTSLVSSVAKDKSGELLLELLKQKKITSNIIFKKNDVTTTKIRSVVGNQQLLRQDFDAKLISLTKLEESKIINKINKNISVIILSDYGKGFLSPALCQKIISKANKESCLANVGLSFCQLTTVSAFIVSLNSHAAGFCTEKASLANAKIEQNKNTLNHLIIRIIPFNVDVTNLL